MNVFCRALLATIKKMADQNKIFKIEQQILKDSLICSLTEKEKLLFIM